jgi:hypothetical protein
MTSLTDGQAGARPVSGLVVLALRKLCGVTGVYVQAGARAWPRGPWRAGPGSRQWIWGAVLVVLENNRVPNFAEELRCRAYEVCGDMSLPSSVRAR